ncbi:hypothetical protein [Ruegeria lacuscaerulensis]|uniref:hypothetical protein n=1 Tax=Ruegeria lacuscaerulensis TaxID=55218 RepID=UPI00147C3297|nr:hypothetical protein [Ruegeria lacuscaerulensis]
MSLQLSRFDKIADISFKVFSVVAICFGGIRYFQERGEIVEKEAQSRSLSYIEEYGSERYVAARLTLHEFWSERPALVQLLTNGRISERAYRAALSQEVFRHKADHQIREALILLDNFYSQVAFCHRAELCDRTILNEFFCQVAQSEAVAYLPFFDRMAAETGDSDLGDDLSDFGAHCVSVLGNP